MSQETTAASIVITDRAAEKIDELALKTNNTPIFRIALAGGGCSGFKYNFCFAEKALDEDAVFTKNSVIVLVDPLSLQYLTGSVLDYEESLNGSRFVIHSENFTQKCGCGNSFGM